jgi:hypothetical protein
MDLWELDDLAQFVAAAIRRLHEGGSIVELLEGYRPRSNHSCADTGAAQINVDNTTPMRPCLEAVIILFVLQS